MHNAIDDAEKFLTGIKDNVQRWISLLAEGKLTSDDLLWLIKGKRDHAELLFLKQKGLTKPDLDRFFYQKKWLYCNNGTYGIYGTYRTVNAKLLMTFVFRNHF